MTIEGAMSSALNGLNAFSLQVGNISDNLANISTTGFKRVDSRFKELLQGPETSYSDPVSVRQTPIYRNDLAGTVTQTGVGTNFAVSNGQGMVPVRSLSLESGAPVLGTDSHYTQAGDFSVDANTYLVNSAGECLMAVQENPPFSGNFPDTPSASDLVPVRAVLDIYKTIPPVQSSTISVNANFPASIDPVADPASGGPAAGASPNDQTASVKFYDDKGTAHSLDMNFRKTAADTWEVVGATVMDTPPVTIPTSAPYQTVNFDQYGKLTAPTQLTFSASNLSGGGSLSNLTIDLGTPTSNSTQYAANALEIRDVNDPNGHSPGDFTSANVDQSGNITFKYSNGVQISPYRIPLATFTNPDLLDRVSGAVFGDNPLQAGTATYNWSGSGPAGDITPGSVEQSNVDIASELTKMLTAQRAYSSNAKIISTADSMTETAITLKT